MSGAEPAVAAAIAPELIGMAAPSVAAGLGAAGGAFVPGMGMLPQGLATLGATGALPAAAAPFASAAPTFGGALMGAAPEIAPAIGAAGGMGAPGVGQMMGADFASKAAATGLVSPQKLMEMGAKGLLSEQQKRQQPQQGMMGAPAMPMMPRGPYQSITGNRPISQFLARR